MDRRITCAWAPAVCAVLGLLCLATPIMATVPPTPEQIAQYKADGTWEQRLANAYALGNHEPAPGMAAYAHWRVEQLAREAAGLPPLREPPPARQGGLPTSGSPNILVILVEFPEDPDDPNDPNDPVCPGYAHTPNQTQADVYDKCFQDGDPNDFPYESVHNYFERASYNTLHIQGNVLGWYMAQHSRCYYSDLAATVSDGFARETLFMEALDYFDSQGHDFTQYDNDGNGTLDTVYLKYTGPDNGWAGLWWAYKTSWWANPGYTIDGKEMDTYVWGWIGNPEGGDYDQHTEIHETGHALGLPDYYDYDDTVGPDGGIGGLDMQHDNVGDWNCYSKFMVDWITPTTIVTGAQTVTLNPSGTSQDCVLIMPGVTPGDSFDEYFMVQYRKAGTGNDPANYPTGLAIWHVDATLDGTATNWLYNNSYTDHKLLRRMEADGLEEIETGDGYADAGDFYLPPSVFGPLTTPNSDDYTPAATDVLVYELSEPGATITGNFGFFGAGSAGAAFVAEACDPPNLAIDPDETVTLSLTLENLGGSATTDLVATLLPTGGVTSPSGPQSYGALAPGATDSRDFTFTATGVCGDTLTVTLQLQDGATTYAPATYDFTLGTLAWTQDFDGETVPALPTGWTATLAQGPGPLWATDNGAADTAPNAAFAPSPAAVSDNRLDSPSIPITTADTQLEFWHQWDFNDYWDAGVLEISVDGGVFQDILDAGASFVTGGYTRKMDNTTSNPLTQRWAWADTSDGFVQTIVDLPPALVGSTVVFRWRLGSSASAATPGWWVDSFRILNDYACCGSLVGDMNCDGLVNNGDIDPFVLALNDVAGYQAAYPDCDIYNGDVNGDSLINNGDIDPFVALLTGG